VVEEDAEGGRNRHRDEHAEDPGPAEPGDEGDDDQDRGQAHGVTHDFRIDEVEDDVGDQEVDGRDQQGLDRTRGQADQDRWNGTDERTQVRDERGDAGDQAEGDRVGESQHPAGDTGQHADQPGDDQLSANVGVQHLADLAPDLVEVGPIVIRHQPAQDAPEGRRVEREKEGDDEHQHELQHRGQRGQADGDRVSELTKEVVLQVSIDRLCDPFEVDVDSDDVDRRSLQAVDPVLSRGRDAGRLGLQLGDFSNPERNDQKHESGEGDDDHDKNDADGEHSWDAESVQPGDGGLDQKRDRSSEHKRPEEIAEQVENDDRHDERGETEDDLQIPPPPLRIERQGRNRDLYGNRLRRFSLV